MPLISQYSSLTMSGMRGPCCVLSVVVAEQGLVPCWPSSQALVQPLKEAEQARAVEQWSWMLLIAPNHLPILGPDSPVSSSNVPNCPALPSGLSRIPKNPNLVVETSHCGTQRTCGHTARNSSTQLPAGRWASADRILSPLPDRLMGSKPQFQSSKILPMGTQLHQMP